VALGLVAGVPAGVVVTLGVWCKGVLVALGLRKGVLVALGLRKGVLVALGLRKGVVVGLGVGPTTGVELADPISGGASGS
jgi:hypothetical protein